MQVKFYSTLLQSNIKRRCEASRQSYVVWGCIQANIETTVRGLYKQPAPKASRFTGHCDDLDGKKGPRQAAADTFSKTTCEVAKYVGHFQAALGLNPHVRAEVPYGRYA